MGETRVVKVTNERGLNPSSPEEAVNAINKKAEELERMGREVQAVIPVEGGILIQYRRLK